MALQFFKYRSSGKLVQSFLYLDNPNLYTVIQSQGLQCKKLIKPKRFA